MHFWFIFEWDVGPHWDKHISRMARTEIRINDLFADRKKGVQSKDRGFATSPSGSRAGLSPQTNFQSNKKLLWFYKKILAKKFSLFDNSLFNALILSRWRRWSWCEHTSNPRDDRPQRDHRVRHRQGRLQDCWDQVQLQDNQGLPC